MNDMSNSFQSIEWVEPVVRIIDQTRLPDEEIYLDLKSHEEVWDAIRQLKVRGAPAIGIAGAYGLYLGISNRNFSDYASLLHESRKLADYLNSSRPTAVNLNWALNKLIHLIESSTSKNLIEIKREILNEVLSIHEEDRQLCKSIGENGLAIVPDHAMILTHCNTGSLATAQFGTAFSVIYHAHQAGKLKKVWVDETRPLLQGSRLTAWEMKNAGIPFTLNIDSAAASLMQNGKVDLVITGADRIAGNGDTANKIGTYSLAVLASAHNIPFYIAAPYSTIDLKLINGSDIEIEQRSPDEVTHFGRRKTAPNEIDVYNPAFDLTPHSLITAIITEKGIIKPDYSKNLRKLFE